MKNKSLLIALSSVAFILAGCNNEGAESKAEYDVQYYLDNPKLAYAKVDECNKGVATIADHEKVFASGDCRNALLAKKQIIKKRNSASNPLPTFNLNGKDSKEKE